MNINVTLSHRRQMPVFVFGSNPNLRQCGLYATSLIMLDNICQCTCQNCFDSCKTIYLSTAYDLDACCYDLNYRKIKAVSFLK